MQRQGSFSQAEYAGKKKQTRRDKFLAEMEQVVPWARLVERLRPFYPKGERGRPPIGLERMLRIHFLQQWYGLADGAMEDALLDQVVMDAAMFAVDVGRCLRSDVVGHCRPCRKGKVPEPLNVGAGPDVARPAA